MTDRPRLTYFDMRGRAEPIRLMLHAMSVEFEDHRIVSPEEWSRLKPRLPFGALPLYETAGLSIAQSHAVFRYLARSFGWAGSSQTHDTLLDITQEALAEAQEDLWRFAWVENHHPKREGYASSKLEPELARLQAWLQRQGRTGPYWVGESLSHVDLIAFCYLDELDAFFPETLSRYEPLAAFRRRIETLPAIAAYIARGDRPTVFGMGIEGPKIDPRCTIPEGSAFRNPWTKPIILA